MGNMSNFEIQGGHFSADHVAFHELETSRL